MKPMEIMNFQSFFFNLTFENQTFRTNDGGKFNE